MSNVKHTVTRDQFLYIHGILTRIGLEYLRILYIIPGHEFYAVNIQYRYEGQTKQRFMRVEKKSGFAEPL